MEHPVKLGTPPIPTPHGNTHGWTKLARETKRRREWERKRLKIRKIGEEKKEERGQRYRWWWGWLWPRAAGCWRRRPCRCRCRCPTLAGPWWTANGPRRCPCPPTRSFSSDDIQEKKQTNKQTKWKPENLRNLNETDECDGRLQAKRFSYVFSFKFHWVSRLVTRATQPDDEAMVRCKPEHAALWDTRPRRKNKKTGRLKRNKCRWRHCREQTTFHRRHSTHTHTHTQINTVPRRGQPVPSRKGKPKKTR